MEQRLKNAGGSPLGPQPRIAVAIATRGRASVLVETLEQLRFQTCPPHRTLICATEPADVAGIPHECDILFSRPGLPLQRNIMLDLVQDADIILYIDDDFLLAPDYIAATRDAFAHAPELVGTTGTVIADHARGPGLTVPAGKALLGADTRFHVAEGRRERAPHCYGCNMAIRLDVVRQHGLRFDERLPLYGWSEDMDFSHRLARFGELAKLTDARGVHLGTKVGRSPGKTLGYSQIANPVYLLGKGSYTFRRAVGSVARNLAMNIVRSLRPEPWVDRRGRLHGNALAVADFLRGRLAPERILEL